MRVSEQSPRVVIVLYSRLSGLGDVEKYGTFQTLLCMHILTFRDLYLIAEHEGGYLDLTR